VVVITQKEKMTETNEMKGKEEDEGSEKKRRVHLLNECDRQLPTT
jgi:hypothetical protein